MLIGPGRFVSSDEAHNKLAAVCLGNDIQLGRTIRILVIYLSNKYLLNIKSKSKLSSAVHGDVNWAACLPLYTAGICWTVIYDTIYAHQDRVDDLIAGVKSTALHFGKDTKKWLTAFASVMTSSLITTGLVCDLSWPYYVSLSAVVAHIAHQVS
jgi:UbiA prenyltransferase family